MPRVVQLGSPAAVWVLRHCTHCLWAALWDRAQTPDAPRQAAGPPAAHSSLCCRSPGACGAGPTIARMGTS
eukprot:2377801-Alexandrium_andersonii.AAC.1